MTRKIRAKKPKAGADATARISGPKPREVTRRRVAKTTFVPIGGGPPVPAGKEFDCPVSLLSAYEAMGRIRK
jgi:hypothetical protein